MVCEQCADCGGPIGEDKGPPDGWQLEDGRTICNECCVEDTKWMVLDLKKKIHRKYKVHSLFVVFLLDPSPRDTHDLKHP